MRHWSQLAIRNWRARPVRAAGAVAALAIGTALVVWVTSSFESIRLAVLDWAGGYIGNSHVNVQSPVGKYGTISEKLLEPLSEMESVVHATPLLIRRLRGEVLPAEVAATIELREWPWRQTLDEFDLYGIDLDREDLMRSWRILPGNGRMFDPQADNECVIERAFAEENGVGVGDRVLVWGAARNWPFELEIVGLIERRRLARFQKGLVLLPLNKLQALDTQYGRLTSIDLVLDEPNASKTRQIRQRVAREVRKMPFAGAVNVRDSADRMSQIRHAQQQQQAILGLLSSVGLLTALFIVLSTLSMGMVERIGQLGLLRCVGVTRWQLAWLALLEVIPLGLLGVIVGVPLGLMLTALTAWFAPEYGGGFAISHWGITLAAIGGVSITLLAALLPTIAAVRVSPLAAARPRAGRPQRWPIIVAGALAAAMLIAQWVVIEHFAERSPWFLKPASASLVLLYGGYAAATPLVVWLVGSLAVHVAALGLGIRARLLQDQVGNAVWRSTGIVCGLMVGLSLIVGLVTFSESFQRVWQFPKQFPEAYIWSFEQIRGQEDDVDEILAEIEGVASFTSCNAVNVHVEERPLFMASVFASVTWFMGCDPDNFFDLVRVEFIEGDPETALAKMKAGRHIIVAEDFARSRNKGVGDRVRVFYGNRDFHFTVAAVVASPALDIAAGYFQANTEMRVVASGSVLGSNEDMARLFNIRGRKLIMLNLDLPPAPVPEEWPPTNPQAARGFSAQYYDEEIPLEQRWHRYREAQKLREIRTALGASQAYSGSVTELKDEIDRELNRVTRILTAIPAVALIVAALGVANLMTANVTARAKQLATIRAVGATKGLILRLVIGEALVLGMLGSALGIGLGLHLAANTSVLADRMWGFSIDIVLPLMFLTIAIGLTLVLCLISGLIPARRAARADVVEALHVN